MEARRMKKLAAALMTIAVCMGAGAAIAGNVETGLIRMTGTATFAELSDNVRRELLARIDDIFELSRPARMGIRKLVAQEPKAVSNAEREALIKVSYNEPVEEKVIRQKSEAEILGDKYVEGQVVGSLVDGIFGLIINNNRPRGPGPGPRGPGPGPRPMPRPGPRGPGGPRPPRPR